MGVVGALGFFFISFNKINFDKKKVTKLIFLKAPIMEIKYKNKKKLTAWFDMYSKPINSSNTYNFEDATKSRDILNDIIIKEAKLLNGRYDKIIIGGHSQGACISLYTGYSVDYLLGGVIDLCGFLFPQANIVGNKEKLKVFLNHGINDTMIPFFFYKESIERISQFEGVEKYYYDSETHFIDKFPQLISDLENFLNRVMK